MFSRAGKEFFVRIRFNLRPFFQGRALLLTNTLSSGVLMALADIAEQTRQNFTKPDTIRDWRRTGNMFAMGCSMGPMMHYWFIWLDKVFVGRAVKTAVLKVLLDQTAFTPLLGTWYFIGMSLFEGDTLSEAWKECTNKFWEMYRLDCVIWPPAQMINFYFVPREFRVMYMNFLELGWDTYLSYLKHREDSNPTELASDSSAVDVQQEVIPLRRKLGDVIHAQL